MKQIKIIYKDKTYLLFFILLVLCVTKKINSQTLEEVRDYIYNKTEIKHKEIVYKQVIQETRWLKCTKCSLDYNNLFGFYWKKKYLVFSSWEDSIIYYEQWQKRHYIKGDYYEFLKNRPFATDPMYISKLKHIKL